MTLQIKICGCSSEAARVLFLTIITPRNKRSVLSMIVHTWNIKAHKTKQSLSLLCYVETGEILRLASK